MLVAHGHDVLHIGGKGHTGHTILMAQHLCHLILLIHIPDAHGRSVTVLGKGEPLPLQGSAPNRARGAVGFKLAPPRVNQKATSPFAKGLLQPSDSLGLLGRKGMTP